VGEFVAKAQAAGTSNVTGLAASVAQASGIAAANAVSAVAGVSVGNASGASVASAISASKAQAAGTASANAISGFPSIFDYLDPRYAIRHGKDKIAANEEHGAVAHRKPLKAINSR
jgi:hypothetical protein